MSVMQALVFGVLILLLLSTGRISSARPAAVAAHLTPKRAGVDPLIGLLAFILLTLILLELPMRGS